MPLALSPVWHKQCQEKHIHKQEVITKLFSYTSNFVLTCLIVSGTNNRKMNGCNFKIITAFETYYPYPFLIFVIRNTYQEWKSDS